MNIITIRGEFSDNGPGTQALNLSNQLRNRGHNVIMVSGGGYLVNKIKNMGFTFIEIPEISYGARNPINIIKSIFKIRKVLSEYEIDIVHGHNAFVVGVCNLASIGLKNKIKFFQSCRGTELRKIFAFRNMIYRIVKYNKIFAVSQYTKDTLMSFGVDPNKIEVTYNGTDLERFNKDLVDKYNKEIRAEFGIPMDAIVIGIIGRMDGIKGHRDVIKIISEISKSHKNVYGFLVGEGSELESNKRLSEQLNISKRVIFSGLRFDAEKLHASFDIFALLSKKGYEMFPNVIVEAMTYGKPFVSVNTTGIPEMAKNNQGIICECDDFDCYLLSFKKLIENKNLRKEMGERGRKSVESNFNVKAVVDKIEISYINS
jgi:glycosyltransferase involved in cell wall biosynthesis